MSQKINQLDSKGKKHGKWNHYWPDDRLISSVNFKHGIEYGLSLHFIPIKRLILPGLHLKIFSKSYKMRIR
jgi:antitoxin component YwqK of YwqJK toxin-antitoxin module